MSVSRTTELIQDITDNYERRNAFEVAIQDEATRVLDLFFIQQQGAPSTTAAATKYDTYTIDLVDATNFDVGDFPGLFTGDGRFYFGEILSKVGNTITMDTPLDSDYPAGSLMLPASRDLNVNGSVTPQVFSIQSGGTLMVDITRIILTMTHGTSGDDGKFGGLTALTNGIVLRKVDGTRQNIWNAKTNGDLANYAYDVQYVSRSGGLGSFGTRCRYTLSGRDKHGVVIRLEQGESLDLIIQDDLTGLDSFRVIAAGHVTSEQEVQE